jgi:putative transposase
LSKADFQNTVFQNMRQARFKGEGTHFVHAISRIVDRRFIFEANEKEHFCHLIRNLSGFTGLAVVTFCIMSNHVHLLVEQPDKTTLPPLTKEELFRRVRFIYDTNTIKDLEQEWQRAEKAEDQRWLQQILEHYAHRMGDVSKFMQELKQRFSQWYNRRNHRTGTLWEGRFKSVLVEGDEEALMTMAAYINLNPVRAGIVSRPEDYRWCGYGAAMGGDTTARAGLGRILDFKCAPE